MVTPHEALRTLRALKPFLAYKIFQAYETKIKIRSLYFNCDLCSRYGACLCEENTRGLRQRNIQRYYFFQNLGHAFDIYRGRVLDSDLDSILACNPDHNVGCNLEIAC